jgi:CRISPR-associated protein Csm1
MDKKYFEICLAALLHDIGKLYYRCLPEEQVPPTKEGKTPDHEQMGKRIVKEAEIDDYSNFFSYIERGSQEVENKIIRVADWISSLEREEQQERPDVRKKGLHCVFSKIMSEENGNVYIWTPKELEINYNEIKPVKGEDTEFPQQLLEKFKEELKILKKDFEELKKFEDERYEEKARRKRKLIFRKLLDIMKRYCIFIPSASYYSKPDIDLYSHSKVSCAVAACLWRYLEKVVNKDDFIKKIKNLRFDDLMDFDYELFLLINGDFSGIQNFISTISTEKATKHLKVRSFYLAYINRLIPIYIVDKLDLTEANIIFSSGGHFEILAPNTEEVIKKLEEIAYGINKFLFENHGGKIYLSIKYLKLKPSDFARGEFSNKRQSEEFYEEVTKKTKKFSEVEKLFVLREQKAICKVCHQNYQNNEKQKEICDVCSEIEKFRELIKKLQKQKKMDKKLREELNEYRKLFDKEWLKSIDYLGDSEENINQVKDIFDFYCLGLPLNGDEIKSFDDLAKEAEEATGYNKIAALKLDLDNLGSILKEGFVRKETQTVKKEELTLALKERLGENKKNRATLSLYSRLSFDISLFFEGLINSLIEKEKYKNSIYVIYSGGDDMFLVGPWHLVIEFAKDLSIAFRKYVCNNSKITISAAMGIYNSKYPVRKIFEQAEEKLELSKSIKEKNGFSLFDFPIKFYVDDKLIDMSLNDENFSVKEELEYINGIIEKLRRNKEERSKEEFLLYYRLSRLLIRMVKEGIISRSFLNKLIESTEDLPYSISDGMENINIRPKWVIDYYLKRMENENNKEIIELLLKLWSNIYFAYIDKIFILPIFLMAVKTAELYTKSK